MKIRMSSVRVRLTVGFLAIVVLANVSVSLVTVLHINRVFREEVEARVQTSLNSAEGTYESHAKEISRLLRVVALDPEVAAILTRWEADRPALSLRALRSEMGLDILSLIGPDGRVVCRAQCQQRSADDLSSVAVVSKALRTRRPASGTVILPRAILERESRELAARVGSRGMGIAAAATVLDAKGRLLGLVFGASLLHGRHGIVDRISSEASREQSVGSQDMGMRASIFQGDVRISTTLKVHGARAVGTRMSEEVRDRVLKQGLTWSDRALALDRWYLTAYHPIRDPDGRIIGALGVGVPEAPFVEPQRVIVNMFLWAMAVTTLGSLLLLVVITRTVLGPITKVMDMSRRVVGGDLSARVDIHPRGEMGLLCQAVNQMADAVEQRQRELHLATQQQIGQSEKLASIGRLAAGIAHEINNPLTGVLTFTHLLRKKPNLDDQDREDLDLVVRETTRVREIVKGLLDFARQSPSAREPLDVNEVVRQSTALLRNQKDFQRVAIDDDLQADLPPISGDRNQLQQVLLNLLLNACEAMPDGGTLAITTGARGGEVVITVADTGSGIKREDLQRIFDPFFTTKPVGKGTGLGLSVSHGIIHQHEGTIEVESTEGKGSTFTVRLPALADAGEENGADA
jgi:two-component system NtrC family sensor kinase